MVRQTGFWDLEERLASLSAAGDPLERLSVTIDFEIFRPAAAGPPVLRQKELTRNRVVSAVCTAESKASSRYGHSVVALVPQHTPLGGGGLWLPPPPRPTFVEKPLKTAILRALLPADYVD